jgi:hypothetical protein
MAHRIHGEPCALVIKANDIELVMHSPDDWAACHLCYLRLLRHDYQTVAHGVTTSLQMPSAIAAPLEAALVGLYSRLQILQ